MSEWINQVCFIGEYMIVITGREKIGELMQNCEIFRATTFQILPIPRSTNHLSSQQLDDEQSFIHLLENHLTKNNFYFSYTYNITLSLQKQGQLIDNRLVNDWRVVKYP